MKLKQILFFLVICITYSCKSQDMNIMTYNIRLDIASDGENAWPNRKDFLSSQVLFLEPDILGVQEARPNQISDLNNAMPNYKYIGKGRDGDSNGEHTAIYYNSEKLKVENEETFWLSQTPSEKSLGWDAAYPRICTYGLFTLKKSKQKVWVFNTHLDHKGPKAQLEGIKLVLQKILDVNTQNLPVFLMGDFNVEPDSEVITETKKSMSDSKEVAGLVYGPEGTFNGFEYDEPLSRRIDYILISTSSKLSVKKYAVLSGAIDSKFPSDHFPVFISVKIN